MRYPMHRSRNCSICIPDGKLHDIRNPFRSAHADCRSCTAHCCIYERQLPRRTRISDSRWHTGSYSWYSIMRQPSCHPCYNAYTSWNLDALSQLYDHSLWRRHEDFQSFRGRLDNSRRHNVDDFVNDDIDQSVQCRNCSCCNNNRMRPHALRCPFMLACSSDEGYAFKDRSGFSVVRP